MKCPKCQTEINSNARFCTKCGCNLAVEMAKAVREPEPAKPVPCAKCGAALRPCAKFCVKCGQAVEPAGNQNQEDRTVFINDKPVNSSVNDQPVRVNNSSTQQVNTTVQKPNPVPGNIVPPDNADRKKEKNKKPKKQKEPKSSENSQNSEKAGKGFVIAALVLLVLVAASGAVCFMVWNGTISLPAVASKDKEDTEEESSSIEELSEPQSEIAAKESVPEVDVTALFAEADAMLADGKNQISVDAEVLNGMETLRNAMNQFADKAQEAGDTALAADQIADAYASYVTAVTRHKDMMSGMELSGAIYSQIMSEIKDAETLAEEMAAKGYTVDTAPLGTMKDAFETAYTEQVIRQFDDFTNRDAWSRTEAWNLMSGFDSAFDSDLDNPLRLRYAYALSWWIQRQVETELANGTITGKGAAIKIAELIEAMDYNPMMINYYITYMNEAGEDCSQVSEAYNEIVQHIADTQGIWIGTDIPLDHFWYFNDFGEYSVDDVNGVTPENRQWIRDRMGSVVFVQ